MARKVIILPHGYTPRGYQFPVLSALDGGCRRVITVWHRRSGKDLTAMNYAIKCMFPHRDNLMGRVGTYYHLFPTYAQGKKIIWDGMTDDGRPYLDFFPRELFPPKQRNETELRVECINGSAYQIVGTDKLDSIVGTNQVACIFSEYSLQNPKAKDLIMPILIQNGGWAWFIYTPRGRNHGWELWEKTRDNPEWFRQLLTIADTLRDNGKPVITREQVQKVISDEGMDPDLAQQEFYCSFLSGVAGSYYAKQLLDAENSGRVSRVPHDPLLVVDTWWDIGVNDDTAIWFTQQYGKEIRVIDYMDGRGEGLPYYASLMAERRMSKHYTYGSFNFPWDMNVKSFSTGRTRLEQALSLGLKPARCVPRISKEDGIAAVRAILPRCWFDKDSTKVGYDHLMDFHKKLDETKKIWVPVHDSHSNAADAFKTLAVGIQESTELFRPSKAETNFDIWNYHRQSGYESQQTQAESEFNVFY